MWQPITTAPRDGTIVIVRGKWRYADTSETMMAVAARYDYADNWWRDNDGGGFTVQCHPTHWMPLPAAPPQS